MSGCSKSIEKVNTGWQYCHNQALKIKWHIAIVNEEKVPVRESRKGVRENERETLENGFQHL